MPTVVILQRTEHETKEIAHVFHSIIGGRLELAERKRLHFLQATSGAVAAAILRTKRLVWTSPYFIISSKQLDEYRRGEGEDAIRCLSKEFSYEVKDAVLHGLPESGDRSSVIPTFRQRNGIFMVNGTFTNPSLRAEVLSLLLRFARGEYEESLLQLAASSAPRHVVFPEYADMTS